MVARFGPVEPCTKRERFSTPVQQLPDDYFDKHFINQVTNKLVRWEYESLYYANKSKECLTFKVDC
jgi:hypothetical protein